MQINSIKKRRHILLKNLKSWKKFQVRKEISCVILMKMKKNLQLEHI